MKFVILAFLIFNLAYGNEIDYNQTLIVSNNKEFIHAGEILEMSLYTFDKAGQCIDDKDYSSYLKVKVTGRLNNLQNYNKIYDVIKTDGKTKYGCKNEYKIITTNEDKYINSGVFLLQVFNGDYLIAKYNHVCLPLDYSKFYLDYDFNPAQILIQDTPKFIITGTDEYGNNVEEPLIDDLEIKFTKDGLPLNKPNYDEDIFEVVPGVLEYKLINQNGKSTYQMHMYYKGEEIKTVNNGESLPDLIFGVGPCVAKDNSNLDFTYIDGYITYKRVNFTINCYDIENNKITNGGEKFSATGNVITESGSSDLNTLEIKDNGDGTYTVSFIPDLPAKYIIKITNNGEKYGEDISIIFKEFTCSEPFPILCPNKFCVSDYLSCIVPPNDCNKNTPFKCKVNGTEMCVKSQTDCDCPEGYMKCDYMHYCVPQYREDMCPTYKGRKCSKLNLYWELFDDGICRYKESRNPSQRVCPIGKVLCCDLSCQDSYDLCPITEELPGVKTRCVEQTITNYAFECPSTITCSNPDYVVCSDGKCVENEIMCKPLRECPPNYPYLCNNFECAKSFEDCSKAVVCGDGKSLCEYNDCREICN